MQEPRKKFEFQPFSDRNTLAGKPVQGATNQAPDARYASVPSIVTRNQGPQASGVQQKVEQFASFVQKPQVTEKPRSIEDVSSQFGGASKIGKIAGYNMQNVPGVKSFAEDTDFVYTPDKEEIKIENDPTQSIADFIATLDAKPELTEEDIQTKFPEFVGKEQALADLIATMAAKPELTQEEIQVKFPELYATDVQDKLGTIELDKKQAERNPFFDFLGKTGEDIKTRFTRVKEDIKDSIKDIQERPEFARDEIQQSLLRIVGEGAGFVGNDIITNLVQSIASPKGVNAFNKGVENIVKKLNTTEYGKAGIDLLSQGAEAYQGLENTNPELKKDIDAIVNIASIIPIGKGTKISGEAIQGTDIAQSIGKQVDTMLPGKQNIELVKPNIRSKVEVKLTPKIEDKIQKAIKPTVIEKKGSNILQKFNNDVVISIDTVQYYADKIELKDEAGELINRPIQSIKDFGDAIFQSKKYLYDEYNAIKTQAGGKGLEVELGDTISELQKSKAKLQRIPGQKQTIAYIDDQIDDLTTIGKLSVDDAQTAMQIYNEKLDAFYRNPQPNDVGKASIDALINNSIRNNMNKGIELATGGPEYQVLKDRYRALMNIEKEVMKRAIVSGRQNGKALLDFSDLFTADQAIGAIVNAATGNAPGAVKNTLSAVFVNGLKNMYKKINSPDTNLRELFEIVAKDRPNILQPKNIDDTIIDSVNMSDNALQGMGLTKKGQEQFVAGPQQLGLPEKSQGYNLGTKENPIIGKSPEGTILRRVQDKAEFIEKPQGEKPKQDVLSRAITKAKAKTVKEKLIAPEKTPDIINNKTSNVSKGLSDLSKELGKSTDDISFDDISSAIERKLINPKEVDILYAFDDAIKNQNADDVIKLYDDVENMYNQGNISDTIFTNYLDSLDKRTSDKLTEYIQNKILGGDLKKINDDMDNLVYEYNKIQEQEKRIGKIGNKKVIDKDFKSKQSIDNNVAMEKLITKIQEKYNVDQFEASNIYDSLGDKKLPDGYKPKQQSRSDQRVTQTKTTLDQAKEIKRKQAERKSKELVNKLLDKNEKTPEKTTEIVGDGVILDIVKDLGKSKNDYNINHFGVKDQIQGVIADGWIKKDDILREYRNRYAVSFDGESSAVFNKNTQKTPEIKLYRGTNEGGKKKFGFDAYTDDSKIAKTYGSNVEEKVIKPKNLADFTNPSDEILNIIKDNWDGGQYYDIERLRKLATKEKMGGVDFYEIFDDPKVLKALANKGHDYVKINDFAGKEGGFAKHTTYIETKKTPEKFAKKEKITTIEDTLDSSKKEMKDLYTEAKKYKSADEFIADDGYIEKIFSGKKKYNSDLGKTTQYSFGGNERQGDLTYTATKDGLKVNNIFIPKSEQGKGVGTKIYKELNKISLKETGKPLYTKERQLLNGQYVSELSDASRGLRESLVKKGYAEKIDRGFRFKTESQLRKIREEANQPKTKAKEVAKKLLEDKPKVSKDIEPLYTEAKKYKSADEFVGSKGKPVYHGTDKKFEKFKTPVEGEYGSEANFFSPTEQGADYYRRTDQGEVKKIYLDNDVKVWERDIETNQNDLIKYIESLNDDNLKRGKEATIKGVKKGSYYHIQDPVIIKYIKSKGFDGFTNIDHTPNGLEETIGIFSPDRIKTESQLRKIREEVNKKQ